MALCRGEGRGGDEPGGGGRKLGGDVGGRGSSEACMSGAGTRSGGCRTPPCTAAPAAGGCGGDAKVWLNGAWAARGERPGHGGVLTCMLAGDGLSATICRWSRCMRREDARRPWAKGPRGKPAGGRAGAAALPVHEP